MREEWASTNLDSVCKLFTDGNWIESKDQSPKGIRLIQTGNVGNGFFKNRVEKARYIDQKTFDRLKCQEIFEGDCLVSRLPDPVGRACLIPNTGERMITAVDCSILRFDIQKIDPHFFSYYSQSKGYLNDVDSFCTGATRRRISRKNLSKIRIPLPPLHEQRRIIAILDEAFAGINESIANTKKNLANARELFDSYLNDVFTKKGEGWNVTKLSDLTEIQSGGTPLRSKPEYWGGNIAWYSSGELNDAVTTPSQRSVTKKGIECSNAKIYPKGSLLIGMYDTAALKMSILDRDAAFNQAIAAMRPSPNVNLEFVRHAINYSKHDLLSLRRGVRQKNLSLKKIKNIEIFIPSIEEQIRVVDRLHHMHIDTSNLESICDVKLNALNELKQSLLAKAFSGELTADSDDIMKEAVG